MNARWYVSLLLPLSAWAAPIQTQVQLWQTNLVIPTYETAPPDPNPRFYSGRTYQGAKATFYPYPVSDRLTETQKEKSYQAYFLENDFIQICVLPELGGRIFSAVDKANGYDFFYRQHVVKPALIGMLGAWISGGVEWNVPHHHRASSFMAVDVTTTSAADGSKTVWVGETERRHRLKWLIGLTVYPDRSFLELNCQVSNPTPFPHPMLFWINPAVHANTNYQVLFPPGTEWATQHGKPEFATWPVARQVYGGVDYTRGVDISWWKNHPSPVSFFAWNHEDDWFGGYDHGRQAGVLHVADHHIVPGKKFFEWGNGPEGEMWTKILSDEDGPYLELMAGAWSDNQPDYSWIQPGETRRWKHWWFPIRNIGAVKNATVDAAVNLEVEGNTAKISVNTTKEFKAARIRLEWASERRVLAEKSVDLSPARPYSATIPLENSSTDMRVAVLSADGKELVSHQMTKPRGTPMPSPVERPKSPADYATLDELYFTGQRIEQLYSPSFEAASYYTEMLRRDPGDYRGNTALGILLCKQWRWSEAIKHLEAALARATANHIRPKDGEAFYYLGVARRAEAMVEGKEAAAAQEAFQRAAWDEHWRSAASYQLAEMACAEGNFPQALELIDRALAQSRNNAKARNLKSTILRALDRPELAAQWATETLASDPLNFRAAAERVLAQRQLQSPDFRANVEQLRALMGSNPDSFLELAVEFANAGRWKEVSEMLADQVQGSENGAAAIIASERYWLAIALEKLGRGDEAEQQFAAAARVPSDFCFPHRYEEEFVFRRAMQRNPNDARAPYYLGCLLYDNRPADAIAAWEKARALDDRFAPVHRNLALGYAQFEKAIPKAVASLERAVSIQPASRFLYELDALYEASGADPAKRWESLAHHQSAAEERDDAAIRLIVLLVRQGQHDRAIEMLKTRHFRNWEGSREIHDIYVDAYLSRGLGRFKQAKINEALQDFESARLYPENLEAARPYKNPRETHVLYLLGAAQEALGRAAEAKEWFEKAVARKETSPSEHQFFQGLALRKLGKENEARRIFEGLIRAGQDQLSGKDRPDYFAKFGERQSANVRQAQAHYLIGLGHSGLGAKAEAKTSFAEARRLHPSHLLLAADADASPRRASPPQFFAFHNGIRMPPAETAELLKELGYDGLSGDGYAVAPFVKELQSRGLKLFNTYVTVEWDAATPGLSDSMRQLIDQLQGAESAVWIAVMKVSRDGKPVARSSSQGDGIVLTRLREISEYAKPRGVKLALYPHTGFWLERLDDAVRVANKLGDPNVGATFNLCHWLKVEGDEDPSTALESALPRLFFVSINGADGGGTKNMDWKRLIQPLGQGDYDVAGLVKKLMELGYSGPVGLQCYAVPGDPKENLTRSMSAWRKMTGQLHDTPPP